MTETVYDETYYQSIKVGSGSSAKVVSQIVYNYLKPNSLIDFGCGIGTWVNAFADAGVENYTGLDGEYINREQIFFDSQYFIATDLTRPVQLDKKYDLAISMEVAEHLKEKYADTFVESITSHANKILFSAATPGQGGINHINEQPLDYWREKFAKKGYVAFDAVRPLASELKNVEPWYRYNSVIYIHESEIENYPELAQFRVPANEQLKDYRDTFWRLRCGALNLLPQATVNLLAKAKHQFKGA